VDIEITEMSNAYPQWDEDYTSVVARVSESAPVNTVSSSVSLPLPFSMVYPANLNLFVDYFLSTSFSHILER